MVVKKVNPSSMCIITISLIYIVKMVKPFPTDDFHFVEVSGSYSIIIITNNRNLQSPCFMPNARQKTILIIRC